MPNSSVPPCISNNCPYTTSVTPTPPGVSGTAADRGHDHIVHEPERALAERGAQHRQGADHAGLIEQREQQRERELERPARVDGRSLVDLPEHAGHRQLVDPALEADHAPQRRVGVAEHAEHRETEPDEQRRAHGGEALALRQNRERSEQREHEHADQSIDEHADRGRRFALRVPPRDHHRLHHVSAGQPGHDDVEEKADVCEAKRLEEPRGAARGAQQPPPAQAGREDAERRQSEREPQPARIDFEEHARQPRLPRRLRAARDLDARDPRRVRARVPRPRQGRAFLRLVEHELHALGLPVALDAAREAALAIRGLVAQLVAPRHIARDQRDDRQRQHDLERAQPAPPRLVFRNLAHDPLLPSPPAGARNAAAPSVCHQRCHSTSCSVTSPRPDIVPSAPIAARRTRPSGCSIAVA